jgi:hypothetical protein
MANITVTASTSNVNVNSTTNTVDVTTTTSNIVVGTAAVVANSVIRAAISGTDPIDYNSSTGVISVNNTTLLSGQTTDNLTEGSTNQYYTDARSRAAVSVTQASASGDGTLAYDNGTGVFTYTPPDLQDVGLTNAQVKTFIAGTNLVVGGPLTVPGTTDKSSFRNRLAVGTSSFDINTPQTLLVHGDEDGGAYIRGNVEFDFAQSSLDTFKKFINVSIVGYSNAAGSENKLVFAGNQANSYYNMNLTNSHIISDSNITATANTSAAGPETTGGYIIADYFEGNGSLLTGITGVSNADAKAYIETNGLNASANLTTTANVNAGFFHGDGSNITGVSTLTNTQVVAHIATVPLSVGGNLSVTGNIDATGNINYQNVTDLYVTDQKITLNANATTDATVEVISNRPESTYDAKLTWNEPSEVWTFMNGDNTFHEMLTSSAARGLISTTTASASGNGSLAYDNGTGVFTFTPADTSLATKTTTNLAEGTNLYYTNTRSRGALSVSVEAANAGGDLTYNSSTGVFSYTPPQLSNFIDLNDLSVTTNTASGNGSLAYNSGTGVFTFTPADATGGYGDSNVTTLLGSYTSAISSNANITTTANISGNYILGNGSQLSGVINQTNATFLNLPRDANANSTISLADGKRGSVYIQSVPYNGTKYTPYVTPVPGVAGTRKTETGVRFFMPKKGVGTNDADLHGNLLPIMSITSDIETVGATGYGALIADWGLYSQWSNSSLSGNLVLSTYDEGTSSNDYQFVINSKATIKDDLNAKNVYITTELEAANASFDAMHIPSTTMANVKPNIRIDQLNSLGMQVEGATSLRSVNMTNGYAYGNLNVAIPAQASGNVANFKIDKWTSANTTTNLFNLNSLTDELYLLGNLDLTGGKISTGQDKPLVIDTNTQGVDFQKSLGGSTTTQLTLDNRGYAPVTMTTPTYSNTSERVAWVIEGTTTAGSNVITVTTAEEWGTAYGTSTFNGTAPTSGQRTNLFSGSNPIAVNYVGRSNGSLTKGASPFPPGSVIQSIDASANTITMSNPATETFTMSWNGGGSDTNVYMFSGGNRGVAAGTTGYTETVFSHYDLRALGFSSSKVTIAVAEIDSFDQYGFSPSGPNWTFGDIEPAIGTRSDYSQPTYTTRGRTELNGANTFLQTNFGISVGANSTVTNRITNDQFASLGYTQLWDGTESYATDFGNSGAIPQIGTKQYTDNSLQATTPYIGTRLQFNSAYGQITDDISQWYPRTGQELGRVGWWGSHGDLENPSSLAAPAYISVQAADDWTNGSNASMYFVATSDYSQTYREPFISYEKGNLILASGNVGGVTQNITFAPAKRAQGSGANPAGTYDFVGGLTSTAAFGTINYANTSANSGSKFSVNNGGSLGAGTVGDMKISVHRKDNSYTANAAVTNITAFWSNAAGGGSTSQDVIQVNAGAFPRGANVTFSGVTTNGWQFLNGNTYVLTDISFGDTFSGLTQNGSPVSQANTTVAVAGSGQYEYVSSQASGVTDKEWSLTLAEQSEDLVLKGNTTTQVTFTDARTQFNSPVDLRSYSTTEINALSSPQEGDTVYNNTLHQICFYNGTAWQKITSANM